jgi:hypothetical protein
MVANAWTVLVVLSAACGIAAARRAADPAPRRRVAPVVVRLACHPLAQWVAICGLLFANQILCDAYIVGAHAGDPHFVTRYLGPEWFDIVRGPQIHELAARLGDVRWLAPTVLRVQAFLELPFTVFAYLAVARLLGADLQRALVRPRLLVPACASFTAAFMLVELRFANPWTRDDLLLRTLSACVTPVWAALASHVEGDAPAEARPRGLAGLAAFLVGAAAIAYLVLAVYDTCLLYNLAHVPRYALGGAIAGAIALACTWLAPRMDRERSSPAMAGAAATLASFTACFFVPSLVLRYAASERVAQVAGLAVVAAAVGYARRSWTWAWPVTCVAVAMGGLVGAIAALLAVRVAAFPELVLASFAIAFLAAAIAVLRAAEALGDWGLRPGRRGV